MCQIPQKVLPTLASLANRRSAGQCCSSLSNHLPGALARPTATDPTIRFGVKLEGGGSLPRCLAAVLMVEKGGASIFAAMLGPPRWEAKLRRGILGQRRLGRCGGLSSRRVPRRRRSAGGLSAGRCGGVDRRQLNVSCQLCRTLYRCLVAAVHRVLRDELSVLSTVVGALAGSP